MSKVSVNEHFSERWIGVVGGWRPWPPRSPVLTLIFMLMGVC